MGFNEAAGFTRRKRIYKTKPLDSPDRFNEAAGFTRRKLSERARCCQACCASMRPPDLPGGNGGNAECAEEAGTRFNEAAGFTRRKPRMIDPQRRRRRPLLQ